mmetsp:Transcript_21863/g.32722  ORF Transcript_21863/g.32722 Transcript_21863/m.32722 type:complete len:374 (+) Transcript_21863:130-1251(+)
MNPFRSSRPPSVPVRDPIDDPTDNCCHSCQNVTVQLIHFAEFFIGLALLGYSIAISSHQPDPQRGFAWTLQLWSALFIVASALGTLGLAKDHCRRIPLTISCWMAPVQAIVGFVFLLIVYTQRESLLNYFKDKHEQLFLSLGLIEFFENNIILIYGFLLLHIAAEFTRFSFINSMKEDFILRDRAKRSGLLRVEEEEKDDAPDDHDDHWAANNRRRNNDIAKSNITSPLITNDEEENNIFSAPKVQTQWWEECPSDELRADRETMTKIKHNKMKTLSGPLRWMSRSFRKEDDSETDHNNNLDKSNDSIFSPVEEDIDFEEPATDARTLALNLYGAENNDSSLTPSWIGDGDSSRTTSNNDTSTDLSWAKDDSK